MYLVDERRKLILEDLMSAGTVYVSDLARKYEVTYETIRKDLTHLEQKGLLIKSPWWGDFKAKGHRASLSGQGKRK
ncbi:DeoR family transcriptional regulator [Escherichia coli]|nr:DeoR family transcriptional regulator [Escherichia coli]